MSNLLKSKILLGVMIVAVLAIGAFTVVNTVSAQQEDVSASDIQYAATVRQASGISQAAVIWQKFLNRYSSANLVQDGKFGPLSVAQAKIWQTNRGLSADGVLGALSRAAAIAQINGGVPAPVQGSCPTGYVTITAVAPLFATCGPAPVEQGACPTGYVVVAPVAPTFATCALETAPVPVAPLEGTAGTVSYTQLSQYSSEEVGSGSIDIKVAGFELEASDGDVSVKSFKLTFDDTGYGTGDSTRLVDYLSSVSIWKGTTKIGTAETADFTRDSTAVYSKVVTVSDAIVRDGNKDKFYITVNGASKIDSGDISSDSWTVDPINVRYEDGSGVVSTDTITQTAIPLSFVTSVTASDTKLKIALNSTPAATAVEVDSSNNTDDVVLLKGKLTAEGTSDIWLDALPVTLTAATTSGSINAITGTVTLKLGDNTYTEVTGTTNCLVEADFSTASTCSTEAQEIAGILFNELDYTIPAGTTVNFSISADINDLDATVAEATNFDAGDSLKADVTATGRAFTIAENELGDQLSDSTEMTGTALGEVQTFYVDGIAVALDSVDADSFTVDAVDNDRAELVIKFKVTAFGDDAYIPSFMTPTTASTNATVGTASSSTAPSTASGVAFHVQSADTGLLLAHLSGSTLTSTADEETNSFKVVEGATETFTLKVIVTNASGALDSASVRALLAGINFGNSDSATGDYVYTSDLANTFKTNYATIAD